MRNNKQVVDDMSRNQGDRQIISHPVHIEPHGADTRAMLTKPPVTAGNVAAYSSIYTQSQVLSNHEHGQVHLGKSCYFVTSTVPSLSKQYMTAWLAANNGYDTAAQDAFGRVDIWTPGYYEVSFSVQVDAAPNAISYADCALRLYGNGGAWTQDEFVGCDRYSGTVPYGITLRFHRVLLLTNAAGAYGGNTLQAVYPVIQVNTATANPAVYYGYFSVHLLLPSRVNTDT